MSSVLSKVVEYKQLLSFIVLCVGVLLSCYAYAERKLDELRDSIAESMIDVLTSDANRVLLNQDYYRSIYHDLIKQVSKIDADSSDGDLKKQDIIKFTEACDGAFGTIYIPSMPISTERRDAQRACQLVQSIYSRA